MPRASWRMPSSGSSAISTSAIRPLVVGSHPGNSMPAALRTRLRPPSHPTRYSRPQRLAVGQLDVDAGVVLREARHLASAMDRHRQLVDPAGQDALDVVLPQPEPVGVPGGEVADVQAGRRRTPRPAPPAPRRGTGRRSRAGRAPRSCARAGRRRASRRAPGSARRSTIATSTPASASSPASISPVGPPPAITTACSVTIRRPVSRLCFGRRFCGTTGGLAASPPVRYTLEVEGSGAPFLSFVRCGSPGSVVGHRAAVADRALAERERERAGADPPLHHVVHEPPGHDRGSPSDSRAASAGSHAKIDIPRYDGSDCSSNGPFATTTPCRRSSAR